MNDIIIHMFASELLELKERLDPKSYAACGKCGAILLTAMDLIKALYDIIAVRLTYE